jgi:hypothetical protein
MNKNAIVAPTIFQPIPTGNVLIMVKELIFGHADLVQRSNENV